MKKSIMIIALLLSSAFFLNACEDEAADYPNARHYETNSVFVLDNDVYVTGWYNPDHKTNVINCYWVNGERVDRVITDDIISIMSRYGFTKSFSYTVYFDYPRYFIHGADIYKVSGSECKKNGQAMEINLEGHGLSSVSGFFYTSLSVSGEDVYVSGNIAGTNPDGSEGDLAFIWKNGVSEYFDRDYYSSIYAYGDDVYGVNFQRAYENNVMIEGSYEPGSYYESVMVDNGDVYLFGFTHVKVGDQEKYNQCYWKNSVRTNLVYDEDGYVSSMFVTGGDVYFSAWYPTNGYYSPDIFSEIKYSMPCYYRNGERIDLE